MMEIAVDRRIEESVKGEIVYEADGSLAVECVPVRSVMMNCKHEVYLKMIAVGGVALEDGPACKVTFCDGGYPVPSGPNATVKFLVR